MSARGMKKIESLCDASFVNLLEDLYDASQRSRVDLLALILSCCLAFGVVKSSLV